MATTYTRTITKDCALSDRTLSFAKAYSADAEDNRAVTIPAGATNLEIDIGIAYAQLVSLFMAATADLTIKTNHSGSNPAPDNTIALKAMVPLVWNADSYFTNPLTADVTKLYVSNAGAVDTVLEIAALQDSTP